MHASFYRKIQSPFVMQVIEDISSLSYYWREWGMNKIYCDNISSNKSLPSGLTQPELLTRSKTKNLSKKQYVARRWKSLSYLLPEAYFWPREVRRGKSVLRTFYVLFANACCFQQWEKAVKSVWSVQLNVSKGKAIAK